jgi:CTD nuclear envelope phosphatase 1
VLLPPARDSIFAMNSLNLLSSRVIGSPVSRPRSLSHGEALKKERSEELPRGRSYSDEKVSTLKDVRSQALTEDHGDGQETPIKAEDDEKQPLLDIKQRSEPVASSSTWKKLVKRLADAITALLAAMGAPAVYLAQCFQDEDGRFRLLPKRRRKGSKQSTANAMGLSSGGSQEYSNEKPANKNLQETKLRHSYSSDSLNSTTTDSDSDRRSSKKSQKEETEPRRSSIRIKEQNDPALKKRKQKRGSPLSDSTQLTTDNIKSPTSPIPSLKVTRYPHFPQPPRPLVPKRQPSYSNIIPRSPSRHTPAAHQQKTLILDLDETLIHSLAKGGRMSSGHMVEVKLNAPVAISSPSNQPTQVIGPQHPILYYVHKRPHCDEFLRKVCKWYKLVVFTASVQEYADPVVDWLELERKYFVGRYYRQHCTFRNGAYIKDLSSIEPDLSKVIILDNSPVSYIFHEGKSSSLLVVLQ